jgi:GNAT superfamily N-acetyltransferase
VRTAGSADARVLARLRRAWAEEQVGSSIEDDGFDDAFAQWHQREANQSITWLAEIDARPVGMLNMLVFTRMPKPRPRRSPPRPRQWGYIANVYVDQGCRDHGIGRLLLDAAIVYSDSTGLARLVLSPSERAVPFYARAGFVPRPPCSCGRGPLPTRLKGSAHDIPGRADR